MLSYKLNFSLEPHMVHACADAGYPHGYRIMTDERTAKLLNILLGQVKSVSYLVLESECGGPGEVCRDCMDYINQSCSAA